LGDLRGGLISFFICPKINAKKKNLKLAVDLGKN
jgi:hypothetical protein